MKVYLLTFTLLFDLFFSNKKCNPNHNFKDCVVKNATSRFNPKERVINTFDDRRVVKTTFEKGFCTFEYLNKRISFYTEFVVGETKDNGSGYCELDDEERIIKHVRIIDKKELATSYVYDTIGYLISIIYPDGSKETLTWKNGNLIRISNSYSNTHTDYTYTSEALSQSEFDIAKRDVGTFLLGYHGRLSKNLIKTRNKNDESTTYIFQKNVKGNIISMKEISKISFYRFTEITDYTYNCF